MPTIKDKLYFNFDGISSSEFGLLNIVLDSGMYDETFTSSREIIETKMNGNPKPVLHSIETSPLQFEMIIAFEDKYTDRDLDKIIRWLFVDYYRPLYFQGKENKVYMAMPVDDSSIIHNGINEGYITLTMRCDSSNIYSPVIVSPLETISTTKTITLAIDSHFDIYPEISIKKIGNGTITIESLDDNNSIFMIKDLTNYEDIYINSEKEIIVSDIPAMYRYDKLVGDFPRMVYLPSETNRFKITGACEIKFRYKNLYKF